MSLAVSLYVTPKQIDFRNAVANPKSTSRSSSDMMMTTNQTADALVAADGSGNYTTVAAAIAAAPANSDKKHLIHIKRGRYTEFVVVGQDKPNIVIVGDGMDATVISGSRCHADGFETPATAVVSKFIIHEYVVLCLKFRQTVLKNRRSTKLCYKLQPNPGRIL
jgi:pectin methylesterase-like acyl-CoA thioesterase